MGHNDIHDDIDIEVEINYVPIDWALKQHDYVLQESGGLQGILNKGLLESALEHIKDPTYYKSISEKAAHLMFSIIMSHIFIDANKRSSIAITAYFLSINGYDHYIGKFMVEMEYIVVMVAEHLISQDELVHLIMCIIFELDYPDNLNIKIENYKNRT